MAHMLDMTTGQAAIAYVGEAPWHKLGQRLTDGADLETWRREAGLAYTVQRTPVLFQRADAGAADRIEAMEGRDVLYRSVRIPLIADTHSKLIADSVPHDRGHPGRGA